MGALGGIGALSSLAGGGGGKGGGGGGGSNLGALFGAATGQNQRAMQNRYQQLGLGGSSMEQQDVGALGQMGLAAAQPLEQGEFQNQLALGQLQNQAQANLLGGLGSQTGFTGGGSFGAA